LGGLFQKFLRRRPREEAIRAITKRRSMKEKNATKEGIKKIRGGEEGLRG